MYSDKVFIEVEGEDARAAAGKLVVLIEKEFNHTPSLTESVASQQPPVSGTRADPATIAAIAAAVLAFPGAILTALQLKDRLGKKEQTEQLIQQGRELKQVMRLKTLRFRIGRVEISFEDATYAKLSDLIEK